MYNNNMLAAITARFLSPFLWVACLFAASKSKSYVECVFNSFLAALFIVVIFSIIDDRHLSPMYWIPTFVAAPIMSLIIYRLLYRGEKNSLRKILVSGGHK